MKHLLLSAMRPRLGAILLAVAFLPLACDDAPTEPTNSDGALALADALLGSAGGLQLATVPGTIAIDREAPCPDGGKHTQRGTTSMTADGDERTITWEFTLRQDNCAHAIQGERIVIDGTIQHDGRQRVRLSHQAGSPPMLLEYEARQHGTATTTFRGTTHTCALDLTTRFEAATNTLHLQGKSCGHSIDLRRPLLR